MLAIWVVLRLWQQEWSGIRIWLFSLAIMLIGGRRDRRQ